MILRKAKADLEALSRQYPAIYVTGPRQSGKTTLCRTTFPHLAYANLEDPAVRGTALADPERFLRGFPSGAILDEIQRVPHLTSYLQVRIDKSPTPGQYILTGSQQFEIGQALSQSLAGRAAILRLLPFSFEELSEPREADYWLYHGFYPRIHDQRLDPTRALGDYIELYVERDLHQIINVVNVESFRRFLRLSAGRVGGLLNLSSLAGDVGLSPPTMRNWLSVLRESFIAFSLEPFHANLGKRLVRSPKLYYFDVGIAAYLMGITDMRQIAAHPLRGHLFENMVVVEAMKYTLNRGRRPTLHFFRDADGNEIDLLFTEGTRTILIEIKSAMTFDAGWMRAFDRVPAKVTPRGAPKLIVYDGEERSFGDIRAIPVFRLPAVLDELLSSDRTERQTRSRMV